MRHENWECLSVFTPCKLQTRTFQRKTLLADAIQGVTLSWDAQPHQAWSLGLGVSVPCANNLQSHAKYISGTSPSLRIQPRWARKILTLYISPLPETSTATSRGGDLNHFVTLILFTQRLTVLEEKLGEKCFRKEIINKAG